MNVLRIAPHFLAFSCLCRIVVGCGSDAPETTASPPEKPPVEQPETVECSLSAGAGDADLAIPEGGRAAIPLALGEDAESVEVVAVPPGFSARIEGTDLVVKAPYGAFDPITIELRAHCGETTQDATVGLTVRRITWSELPEWSPGTTGPVGREYGTMWIDPTDVDRLLVFGGFHYQPKQFTPSSDTWSLDLTTSTWTELEPTDAPLLPGGRMVPDPDAALALYYGGVDTVENTTPYSLLRFDFGPEALTFSNVGATAPKKSGDYLPATIYDAPRHRYVTACGANDAKGYHCEVNTFDPATGIWTTLEPAPGEAPEGRNGMFYVADDENERLVIFSGEMGSGSWACDCAQDAWALELSEDPVRWVKLGEGGDKPIGRRNGAFAIDPIGHRMFVWGGTADGKGPEPGLYALDLDRGEEKWSKVETETPPPDRASGMGVYDAERGRILFGFGNASAVYADLWALQL